MEKESAKEKQHENLSQHRYEYQYRFSEEERDWGHWSSAQTLESTVISLHRNIDCQLLETGVDQSGCDHSSDKVLTECDSWSDIALEDATKDKE
jgi:hypothetical protein